MPHKIHCIIILEALAIAPTQATQSAGGNAYIAKCSKISAHADSGVRRMRRLPKGVWDRIVSSVYGRRSRGAHDLSASITKSKPAVLSHLASARSTRCEHDCALHIMVWSQRDGALFTENMHTRCCGCEGREVRRVFVHCFLDGRTRHRLRRKSVAAMQEKCRENRRREIATVPGPIPRIPDKSGKQPNEPTKCCEREGERATDPLAAIKKIYEHNVPMSLSNPCHYSRQR